MPSPKESPHEPIEGGWVACDVEPELMALTTHPENCIHRSHATFDAYEEGLTFQEWQGYQNTRCARQVEVAQEQVVGQAVSTLAQYYGLTEKEVRSRLERVDSH